MIEEEIGALTHPPHFKSWKKSWNVKEKSTKIQGGEEILVWTQDVNFFQGG
jgi:hypothetical protein